MTVQTTNVVVFPDEIFTPEQIASLSKIASRMFDAEAQVASLRADIADLQRDVEQLTASNAEADATIEALRAQVAALTERLSRCTCTDDFGNVT